MTTAPPPSNCSSHLQNILQQAVQTVKWTYSIYWKLCPLQRILVWSEGYYNGEIKTRKTVDLKEVSTEEASLQRSQQLRDLYESLCASGGVASETNHQTKRPPSVALLPEDLTESEWYYLLCLSYFFPPAVGLPGSAYAKRQHVWLTGANEADTHLFPRALLAKSAKIQTVVCIPLLDGVIELGTTLNVPEDLGFIQRILKLFNQNQESLSQEPALSQHSTSSPPGFRPSSSNGGSIISPAAYITLSPPQVAGDAANHSEKYLEVAEEEGRDEEGENNISGDSDALSLNDVIYSSLLIQNSSYVPNDDIGIGLIGSESNVDMGTDYVGRWKYVEDDPQFQISHSQLSPPDEEDTHYSQTVAIILQGQSSRCSEISLATSYIHHSSHSAFFKWSFSGYASDCLINGRFSQRKLKYIIHTVPHLHSKDNNISKISSPFNRGSCFRKASAHQQEVVIGGANNVLAERRRREKLNERFVTLKSLVPFVRKTDKASILGDTIEYVNQLRKKTQQLETHVKQIEGSKENNIIQVNNKEQKGGGGGGQSMIKKKMRIVDRGINKTRGKKLKAAATGNEEEAVHVEVSIIENNALVKVQCRHREGLLLDIMQILKFVRVEITTIQSSLSNGVFTAEFKAKVINDNLNGKKVTIMEVKKAILQTVSSP